MPTGDAQSGSPAAPTSAVESTQAPPVASTPSSLVPNSAVPARTPTSREVTEARDAYVAGARALDHDRLNQAETEFARAVTLDPTNTDYRIGQQVVLAHRATALIQRASTARSEGRSKEADALQAEAEKLDGEDRIVTQHAPASALERLFTPVVAPDPDPLQAEAERASSTIGGELALTPAAGRHDLHVHADVRAVATQVFSAWGIRTVFDDSVVPQDVRFDLDAATFHQAAPLVLQMGRLYAVPLDRQSVLIAKDSPEARTRLERQIQETIYIPGYSTEQINELGNVLRNVFDIRQLAVQNTSGRLLVRAPAETMHALNRTLADLIDGGSEVLIDVRLYSVDRTRQRTIGPQFPQQFGVYNAVSAAQSLVSSNQSTIDQAIAQGAITLTGNATTDLISEAAFLIGSGLAQSSLLADTIGFFGKGLTLTGVTAGSASFNLGLNSSEVREIDHAQLRVSDHQAVTFRAGTRYPITNSTYSTGITGTQSSALAGVSINGVSASSLLNQFLGTSNGTTIPQISYEDLGLTLKASPVAQKSGEITMKLDLQIESLSGTSLSNIPILANRQFVSGITVQNGESALMVSTITRQESAAISGIPGIGELPGFQSVTADRTTNLSTSELVVLVTPHVVRRRSDATAGPRIAFSPSPDQRE